MNVLAVEALFDAFHADKRPFQCELHRKGVCTDVASCLVCSANGFAKWAVPAFPEGAGCPLWAGLTSAVVDMTTNTVEFRIPLHSLREHAVAKLRDTLSDVELQNFLAFLETGKFASFACLYPECEFVAADQSQLAAHMKSSHARPASADPLAVVGKIIHDQFGGNSKQFDKLFGEFQQLVSAMPRPEIFKKLFAACFLQVWG